MAKISLTGIRPSGSLHIGNYLGAIKPALELQKHYSCLYFIADLHSLTTTKIANDLRSFSFDLVAAWVALGLDLSKHIMYRQSDVPLVTEYAWYLSCVTGVGFLEKAHAYKDAVSNNREVNHGVFAYPVLMAADILMYEPDVVPVGKDQKQHVEMARNMAGSFNAIYGDVIKLPEPLVDEKVMTIPGLDGRKMSKSYHNVIPLFCQEKELRKTIMSIVTDSTPVEAPKPLKGTLLGDLFALFASNAQWSDLEKRLAAGGMGWGHAKEELFVMINSAVKDAREQYFSLRKDESKLSQLLSSGANRAFEIARTNLDKLRDVQGLPPYHYKPA